MLSNPNPVSMLLLRVVSCGICLTLCGTVMAASYTWSGAASTDYQTSTNWTPERTTPASDDVLQFSSGGSITVTNLATQTVGELHVTNSTYITLSASSSAKTLTINGSASSPDFEIASGSTLKLTGTIQVTINIASGATGDIYGDVIFNSTANSILHRITGNAAGAINFYSGATAAMAPSNSGSGGGFGTASANANSVVFQSGSAYYQGALKDGTRSAQAGSNPFGLSAPNSVVVFNSGSYYYCYDFTPAVTGRTYGYFVDRSASNQSVSGSSDWTIQNDLKFEYSGTTNQGTMNTSGFTGNIIVQGNLSIASNGAALNDNATLSAQKNFEIHGDVDIQSASKFTPSTSTYRVYELSGSTAQNINFASKTISALTVDNSAGVSLSSGLSVSPGSLNMNAGNITTNGYAFTLGNGSTTEASLVYNNTNSPLILGAFTKTITTDGGSHRFPIGCGSDDREIVISITGVPAAGGTVTASFTPSNPGKSGLPLTDADDTQLVNAAEEGYWTVTTGNGFDLGSCTFEADVRADNFNALGTISTLRVVKRDTSGPGDWLLAGTAATNYQSGSIVIVKRTGFSSFSDFGVAGVAGQVPVHLSRFDTE